MKRRAEKVKEILDKMFESDYHPTDKEVKLINKESGEYLIACGPEPEWVEVETENVGRVAVDEQNVETIKKFDKMATELYNRSVELGFDYLSGYEYFSTIVYFFSLSADIAYLVDEDELF